MIQHQKEIDYALLKISSPAIADEGMIPRKYTCDGENINPPLVVDHIPEKTMSLAVIVDDPDAPVNTWIHWIEWNIPVTHLIKEHSHTGTEGLNNFQHEGYEGPCPFTGQHRYRFKVYALDTILSLSRGSGIRQLEKAMAGHILGFGELTAYYEREKKRLASKHLPPKKI